MLDMMTQERKCLSYYAMASSGVRIHKHKSKPYFFPAQDTQKN